MTFLGLEQPVEYGRLLVFDPTTALMVLNANRDYINAVYRDYQLAMLDMKDFNEKYGDFTSPILADVDWYYNNVTGRVKNFINNLYARGIDPLRSQEGRALVQRELATMPTKGIADIRQSAEIAKEYLKSYDDDTNPELEKFLGRDLSAWSTMGDPENGIKANGVWRYNKASKYLTIDDLIEPIVKNVDFTYDAAMTKAKNDGMDYYTITRDRLMQAINDNMSDILATPSGAFHWDLAKKAAAAQGGGEDLAKLIFNTMIGNRVSDHERIKPEANPFRLEDYRTNNEIRAYEAKKKIDAKYANNDGNSDGSGYSNNGYNLQEDVYSTTLSKAVGIEYPPADGFTPQQLHDMRKLAEKNQNKAIMLTGDVYKATGMFISPEKINGLILATGKNGDGYFLNINYLNNLYEVEDMATSYKGWARKGVPAWKSEDIRKHNIKRSLEMRKCVKDKSSKNMGFRLKVLSVVDANGNNTYSFVGDDNRWHTYARMRVYATDAEGNPSSTGRGDYDIPRSGREMVLQVGLLSNVGTGIPDLSLSEREKGGFYGFNATKGWIGLLGNSSWPYGNNVIDKENKK